jgi:hypothetical protein
VWIPSGAGNSPGATVSISDSVIAGNRAAPETTDAFCGFPCAFALGRGIVNAGTRTVTDTRITDNVSGSTATELSVASYAAGGGIVNGVQGSLTLLRSFVNDNRAAVNPPRWPLQPRGHERRPVRDRGPVPDRTDSHGHRRQRTRPVRRLLNQDLRWLYLYELRVLHVLAS